MREKQKQLQVTINWPDKKVEALKQTVEMLFGQPKDVSTCDVGAVTSRKWTEIPPANNIAKFQPGTGVPWTFSVSNIRARVGIFISRLCPICSTKISYPFSTDLQR